MVRLQHYPSIDQGVYVVASGADGWEAIERFGKEKLDVSWQGHYHPPSTFLRALKVPDSCFTDAVDFG